ncbi:MAG: DoxX family membrane protein [Alphaproteobacteria bacterium]|jgi:thiosulfate dehydrogenase [quinone] large subunit|nr:DoxX family membrane protein [Alphaproteobacteria bacterium]
MKDTSIRMAATINICIRMVLGFVFMSGGTRRLIYEAGKLDPLSAGYNGIKLLQAAPGSAFGLGNIVEWLSMQQGLFQFSLIFYTWVELIFGLFLIIGFMTRFSAFVTLTLSVFLMLIFGWLGATCIDEWTMSSYSFAMGIAVFLAGSATLSVDNILMKKGFKITNHKWFPWLFSGDLKINYTKWGVIGGIIAMVFTVGFYDYYRGGVYSKFTARTNPAIHRITITEANLDTKNQLLTFSSKIDAGPDTQALYIINVSLINTQTDKVVMNWDGKSLMNPEITTITNLLIYSGYKFSSYGIEAPLAAKAVITLKGDFSNIDPEAHYKIKIMGIDGRNFFYELK